MQIVSSIYRFVRELKEDTFVEKRMDYQLKYILQKMSFHNRKHDEKLEMEDVFSELLDEQQNHPSVTTSSTGELLSAQSQSQPQQQHMDLYLVIHGLCAKTLRNEEAQHTLSLLASHPHIHLIASVNHIHAHSCTLVNTTEHLISGIYVIFPQFFYCHNSDIYMSFRNSNSMVTERTG